MSVFGIVTNAVRRYQRRRELALTERLISSLPSDIRKDIGWPEPARTTVDSRSLDLC